MALRTIPLTERCHCCVWWTLKHQATHGTAVGDCRVWPIKVAKDADEHCSKFMSRLVETEDEPKDELEVSPC